MKVCYSVPNSECLIVVFKVIDDSLFRNVILRCSRIDILRFFSDNRYVFVYSEKEIVSLDLENSSCDFVVVGY